MNPTQKLALKELLSRDPNGVIAVLAKAVDDNLANERNDPEIAYLLGIAYFRLNNFQSAVNCFTAATSLDSYNSNAFYYLGLSMERQGRIDDAVQAYRRHYPLIRRSRRQRRSCISLSCEPSQLTIKEVIPFNFQEIMPWSCRGLVRNSKTMSKE